MVAAQEVGPLINWEPLQLTLRWLRTPSSIGNAVKAEQHILAIDFCRRRGTCGFLLRDHGVLIGA